MRIAQMAPLYESVPPKYYGGTERVVAYLTEELVRLGHEVTLFASGDSVTSAQLRPQCPQSLRLDKTCLDQLAPHILMLEQLYQSAEEFDILHSHIDYLSFSMLRRTPVTFVATLHGRLDMSDLIPLYREFSDIPVISISGAQREPLPWINWRGTVYHGLPEHLFAYRPEPGKYLAFLGRISPEKRVEHAIEIARKVGMPLKIAAKLDNADREYFHTVVKPLIKQRDIEYVGEIAEREKNDFLGNASALLFPIDWPEPFGLVMIEAMACGTPVIARAHGSVPEIIVEGETGFIVGSVDQAAAAIKKIPSLSRRRCREIFERRFTASRMAEDYARIYQKLINEKEKRGFPGIKLYG